MTASPATQRSYQINCPSCGAIALFRAASTTHTVCSYCSSTLTRTGEVLEQTGIEASHFEDYSLLQIGTQGQFQGIGFTLIGRLQYESNTGRWTEWLALLDNNSNHEELTAILSEDNGQYVWMQTCNDLLPSKQIPAINQLALGQSVFYSNVRYTVTAKQENRLIAAQGECGQQPTLNHVFEYAELRSQNGQLLTLSYETGNQAPTIYLGESVDLNQLKLTGLKDSTSISTVSGQAFNCPNCGNTVTIKLDNSKSITCQSCHSLINLTEGLGAKLAYAIQAEPITPQIALGSLTMIAGKSWQVVGYQHRMSVNTQTTYTDTDDDNEQEGWEEYLLYNAQLGFQFLINSNEGWSLVRPITGTPTLLSNGSISYLGKTYPPAPRYTARTEFVLGEFYWPVKRHDETFNRDFSFNQYRLNWEQTPTETTWSAGYTLSVKSIIQMFNIPADKAKHFRPDVTPVALTANTVKWGLIITLVLALIVINIMADSPKEACQKQFNPYSTLSAEEQMQHCLNSYQQRSSSGSYGGSYGGFYTGSGGHK